jgi:Sporulation and spore germination
MRRKLFPFLPVFLVVLILTSVFACKKKEPPPSGQPARVSATKAYENYFGPAPTTDKGTCFAFVIYFPSAKEPGKVVPFPFFTFDQGSMEKVAVERLLGGMGVPAYRDEIAQPFAPGARLLVLEQIDGLKKVDLSGGFLVPGADRDGMLHALVMTLTQFEEVRGVRLLQEGKDLDYATGPQKPEGAWVLAPGPPRVLGVMAAKHAGEKEIEDVSVNFDRPVNIEKIALTSKDGKPFAGDIYQSVFDMAAVLKTKEPSVFKDGMPVKVNWRVVDKVGRAGEGEGMFPLEVKEH